MMSEKIAVEAKNLIRVYKTGELEVQALRGLSVTVATGEMVALIGPSGSGKSTFLNIIGGLDRATAGYIGVMGQDLTQLNASQLVEFRRKTVGHVFQNMNLIPTLTAAENVELPMAALGVKKDLRHKRIDELIGVVGLLERKDHKPGELSGGEQQRIALAAALANNPPLILADEPTGELDTENAMIVVNYLAKVNRELGKTIIMVTHDPRVARAASRLLRIQDGVIATDVAPSEEAAPTQTSYTDMLKTRLSSIDTQLVSLDAEFRKGVITSDQFVERQTALKRTRDVLGEELHRLGVVH
jgi:putative ABC transport system ATP-binding protein